MNDPIYAVISINSNNVIENNACLFGIIKDAVAEAEKQARENPGDVIHICQTMPDGIFIADPPEMAPVRREKVGPGQYVQDNT